MAEYVGYVYIIDFYETRGIYVGSTSNKVEKRLTDHKYNTKRMNTNLTRELENNSKYKILKYMFKRNNKDELKYIIKYIENEMIELYKKIEHVRLLNIKKSIDIINYEKNKLLYQKNLIKNKNKSLISMKKYYNKCKELKERNNQPLLLK